MFNNYAGYSKSVEGQNQRIKDYNDEYPAFVKFVDEGLMVIDVVIDAGIGFLLGVGEAIFIEKIYNPYIVFGAGVAGANASVVETLILEGTGGRRTGQKLWHDIINKQNNNPYVNPAANPSYF